MNKLISTKQHLLYLLVTLFLLVSSCTTIRLVSDYDEISDKAVTSMQSKTSKFFVDLSRNISDGELEKATYKNYRTFYDDFRIDWTGINVRAAAFDKNRIFQEQLVQLKSMIDNTEQLHKIGFKKKEEIQSLQANFDQAFTAMVKFQLALKRGDSSEKK